VRDSGAETDLVIYGLLGSEVVGEDTYLYCTGLL